MKIMIPALLATIALFGSVNGMLPPLYYTSNEIKAILNDPEFGKKLHSGEMIESLQRNENGFLITTNYHTMQVNIKIIQTEHMGPAHFDLQFEEPVSIR